MYTLRVGYFENGQYGVKFEDYHQLNDDASNKAVPRTYQIVHQIIDKCKKLKIKPDNLAVDATGAGAPFCDVLAGEWSDQFLRVQFGGKPSDKRVSMNSQRTGEELYVNRVSELWFVGKEFMRTQQLRGIGPDLAKELTSREYELTKSTNNLKVKIETKPDLKARLGKSPDLADAAMVALDCARQRHGLVAIEPPKKDDVPLIFRRARTMKDLDVVAQSTQTHPI